MATKKKTTRKKAPAKKNKGGRPRIKLDLKLLERVGSIGSTWKEASAVLGIDLRTFESRMAEHGEEWDAFHRGFDKGNVSLRRWQWRLAESLDKGMLIWLGKQRLGQTDRGAIEVTGKDGEPLTAPQTILYLPDNGRD